MRSRIPFAAVALLSLVGCKQEAKPGASAAPAPSPPPPKGEFMTGEWKRTLLSFDENENEKLDDAERKPVDTRLEYGYTAFAFTDDGKCSLTLKGKTETGACAVVEDEGKKWLEIQPPPDSDELERRYLIILRNEKELALKDSSGAQGSIYLYERTR